MGDFAEEDYSDEVVNNLAKLCKKAWREQERFDGGIRKFRRRSSNGPFHEEVYEGRFTRFPVFSFLNNEDMKHHPSYDNNNFSNEELTSMVNYVKTYIKPETVTKIIPENSWSSPLNSIIINLYENDEEVFDGEFAEVTFKDKEGIEHTEEVISILNPNELNNTISYEELKDAVDNFDEELEFENCIFHSTYFDDPLEEFKYKEDFQSLFTLHLTKKLDQYPIMKRAKEITTHFNNILNYLDKDVVLPEDEAEFIRASKITSCIDVLNYTKPLVERFTNTYEKNIALTNELHFLRAGALRMLGFIYEDEKIFKSAIIELEQVKGNKCIESKIYELFGDIYFDIAQESEDYLEQMMFMRKSISAYETIILRNKNFDNQVMYSYVEVINEFREVIGFESGQSQEYLERGKRVIDDFVRKNPDKKYFLDIKEDLDNPLLDDDLEDDF